MNFYLITLRSSLLTAALLACTLAHAGFRDDAPPIKDPFDGLLPQSALKVGSEAPIKDAAKKRVAIVLTDNTHTHLKWSDEVAAEGLSGFNRLFGGLFAGQARVDESNRMLAESYRASAITAAVLKPFLDTCKEVKVMNDMAEFKDSGFELAAIIDITFMNTFFDSPAMFFGNKYEAGAYLKAWLITSNFTSGPIVAVSKEKKMDRNAFMAEVGALRSAAFSEFQASVKQALGGIDKTAAPAAGAPKSAEERLRELEKLRRDGLITEVEASEKRKKILNGM
jgi:hypothetical protein